MTDTFQNKNTDAPPETSTPKPDLTGRSGMVANVVGSWASHLVFIIAGFILPRMIDRGIGQEALGVWDFAWSLVGYFHLVQGGVVSSINRYVAKYRATGDIDGVNRAVSSVTAVLAAVALLVMLMSAGTAMLVPSVLSDRLSTFQEDAQWAVFFLGTGVAVQLVLSGYGGVVTGCHRWGIHNAIHAGAHVVTVTGMIVILKNGGGIRDLALMSLIGDGVGRLVRCFVAYRVCPGLSVRPRHATWAQARSMLHFGGKSFIPDVADLLMNQTTNILVLAYLGPAAMAVFGRPRALIRHVTTLVSKFAFVLTPTASSLQATGQQAELRELLINAARWSGYITLPLVIGLSILGGPLLQLWMGADYVLEGAPVLTVLAFGYLAFISQTSVRGVLTGLNLHGRPGIANLVASIVAVGLALAVLEFGNGGLVAVSVAVSIPLTVANGIYVPVFACRQLGLPVGRYLTDTLSGPALCGAVFAVALAAPTVFTTNALMRLLAGVALGGPVLFLLYWRFVLPASLKKRVAQRVPWLGRVRANPSR